MALGMTKDSMVDLQSLVQEKNDAREDDDGGADTVSLLTTGQSRGSIGEYKKLAVEVPVRPAEEEEPPPSFEIEEAAIRMRDSIALAKRAGEGHDSLSNMAKASSPLDAEDEEEEKKQDPLAYGHYTGFQSDYDAYNYDAYQFQYHQTPQTLLGGPKTSSGGFLCCLFPWLQKVGNNPNHRLTERGEEGDEEPVADESKTSNGPLRKASSSGEDDDLSTGEVSAASDRLGEKLSDKDRQAVLARLRLAQPDGGINSPRRSQGETDSAGSPGSSDKDNRVKQKGLLNDIPNLPLKDGSKPDASTSSSGPKSILKRQATVVKNPKSSTDITGSMRRSIFPTYDTPNPKKSVNDVQFAPMARVVTVKSQKEMTPEEKSAVWWQRWDYEDFRKTGRIITRAMLEGGSEIWLAANQSWQHLGASKSATLKHAMSLSEKAAKNGRKGRCSETTDLIQSTGDKWWHKFGHSRRGLEHIASIKEGAERQANVRHAIRAVLEEQRRQKTYGREDPEKLRMVSIHNTSWARDLALAAGSSDADAVKSNFDEERKSREFYLLKMARSNTISSQGKHVPAFMQPAINTFSPKLDAHTNAQIMFRRKQQQKPLQQKDSADSSSSSIHSSPGSTKKDKPPTLVTRTMEPIHDPEPAEKGQDLAKRAAGFSHDGAEQVNMAAVLSGMGAVPKIAQPV